MDYRTYQLKWQEWLTCIAGAVLLAVFVSWLLYQSWCGLGLIVLFLPLCVHKRRQHLLEIRQRKLLLEFKDAMQSVSSTLMAGYSMENAWRVAEQEIRELYGENSYLAGELQQINAAVRMNEPIEKELLQFAKRSGCEDILSFAEVFQFAKRSGGDFGKILRTTAGRISDKLEVEREVETVIAGKKMEQKIMNMVPAFILIYLNLTSPDFLEPLYGNLLGTMVMSIALAIYLAAIKLAEKITNINV